MSKYNRTTALAPRIGVTRIHCAGAGVVLSYEDEYGGDAVRCDSIGVGFVEMSKVYSLAQLEVDSSTQTDNETC